MGITQFKKEIERKVDRLLRQKESLLQSEFPNSEFPNKEAEKDYQVNNIEFKIQYYRNQLRFM